MTTVLCLLTGAVCLLYIAGVHKQRFNCSNRPVWYGDITCWSMLGLKDLTVQTFGDD